MNWQNTELINCLLDLGFGEREAKVYLALLNKHSASATELQKLSGIAQSKIYEVLAGLVRRGYCTETKSNGKRTYKATNPEVALNLPFKDLQKRLECSLEIRQKLSHIYQASEKIAEPLEYIEVLKGNDNIHHRYCQLVANTKNDLIGFGRGPYACDTSEKSQQQDQEAGEILVRGAQMRWIYELNRSDEQWLIPSMAKLIRLGERIRVAEKLPLKMMIFDRELLLIAEEEPFGDNGELTMSVIKQKTVVNAFYALFEYFWLNSIEFAVWEKEYRATNVSLLSTINEIAL